MGTSATAALDVVQLSSDTESLRRFDEDFADPHRRALVKELNYKIILPPISEKRTKKFQSKKEAAANTAAITQALVDLFERLSTWHLARADAAESGIKLVTHIEPSYIPPCPMDDYRHDGEPIWIFRNALKYLALDKSLLPSSGLLPEVHAISEIDTGTGKYNLHPSIYAVLTKSLRSLRRVSFTLQMPTRRHMFQRREIRSAFADALRDAPFLDLQVLDVTLNDGAPPNETFALDVFTDSSGQDDLSLAVQRLLQLPRLRKASFRGGWILAPSAFQTDTSFGSHIERLFIEIVPMTPDGKWLTTGNIEDAVEDYDRPSSEESLAALDSQDSDATDYIPDHSWDQEDGEYPQCFFRYTFDSRTFDPLVISLAQGVRRMPALRELELNVYQSVELELKYFASGVKNKLVYRQHRHLTQHCALSRANELEYRFEEENAHRSRWFMTVVGTEPEWDGAWNFAPGLARAMEEGGGRILFHGFGFTGRAATLNAKDTIEYGTNIVDGVSPGKGGQQHLGLPVFDTVMENVKPHASAVFVPAQFAAAAIIEAIEAEVPLVVSVAEHVPVHDMARVHEVLRTQSTTRLVGPNCPGIIAPPGRCRIGIMPYKQYSPGLVGIVSKSGTLSYEAVGATTAGGLGQSVVGIIVIGEIGGEAELRAAEVIAEYRRTTPDPKPIVAMVAGRTAPEGKTMGHAGAHLTPRDVSADFKAKALADAGAVVVPHPGMMGVEMMRLLGL
ncbi:hypothetical protein CSOJ01_15876 [Colletotrichum sojae]|uniref:CoA-binding domain-containing protein n=1 Tax=Colletotrichum sojae TaxID=2175907 RepID=A0A8H6MGT9_9PEZI|nr:hypothetical protein CSOJ01_15876 [Colletotrichum sojae]